MFTEAQLNRISYIFMLFFGTFTHGYYEIYDVQEYCSSNIVFSVKQFPEVDSSYISTYLQENQK